MTYVVYVLFSPSFHKIYIGYTSDLKNRMNSHNLYAAKGYTSKFRPWVLISSENHETKKEALTREKQLKSAQGRKFVWRLSEKDHQDSYPPVDGREFSQRAGRQFPLSLHKGS